MSSWQNWLQWESSRSKDARICWVQEVWAIPSAKNLLIGGEIRNARDSEEFRPFFASIADEHKSHTKISIQ